MWWRSVLFALFFLGSICCIVPHLVWLIGWIGSKIFSYKLPYAPFGWTALVLVVLVWSMVVYGYYVGRYRIEVNNVEYVNKEVPQAFDGYRIVHVSDFHVDSYDNKPEALQKFIDSVNAQKPDLILFTGDMNTRGNDNLPLHEKALRSLHAKDGVISILGNHDFFIYEHPDDKTRCKLADELTKFEETHLGWKVLRNAHSVLHKDQDSIVIAGVDNIHGGNQGFRTIQKGDLKKALAGVKDEFTILLTHDPSHWRAEVLPESKVQITLSGHTHAGQVRLFGWSVANFAFNECDGRYDEGNRMLYVNAGTGCTMPLRFDCPSEITIITLRR